MDRRPAMARPRQSSPRAAGLYDPAHEHDGCGVACLARLDGKPRHDVIERALTTLDRLEHRGAAGADAETGDGAGILIQLPHEFLRRHASEFGIDAEQMPPPGEVAVAVCFLPPEDDRRAQLEASFERTVAGEGQTPLGWRDVPVDPRRCGTIAREAMPVIRHFLIGRGPDTADQDAFERKLFVIRRVTELRTSHMTFPSVSSKTIVYKGMLTAPQLSEFYADLRDPSMTSALAIVHSRFSTNTFPSWSLAHPHRMSAHNGEINTVTGNLNWLQAREAILESNLFGEDLERCLPLVATGTSDSLAFDQVFELLCLAGRSLPHAAMMMIPRAHENMKGIPPALEGFYNYHSRLIEPWDGPAAITFTDGTFLGATLDRNGLRPGRWLVTHDGWAAVSSEAGSFEVADEDVAYRGRLRPGSMFAIDLERGRVLNEGEAEREIAGMAPWGEWDETRIVHLEDLEAGGSAHPKPTLDELRDRQLAFGYSQEDLRVVMGPLTKDAKEPTGSMGNDVALALFSDNAPSLFSYFKQRFAQVTNPAIDSVREHIVMSLRTGLGPETNLLGQGASPATQLLLEQPVLGNEDMAKVIGLDQEGLKTAVIDITFPVIKRESGMLDALKAICHEASQVIRAGASIVVLSDRDVGPDRAAMPALLATSAVHQHLVRSGDRVLAGLAIETGEAREIHHVAALIGYGASAVNPYLMLDTVSAMAERGDIEGVETAADAVTRTTKGLDTGLLKVLSKMGISTISSYNSAQIFEAVGLDRELVSRHFTGTSSSIGGVGLDGLAREALDRHSRAYPAAHGLSRAGHVESALLPAAHDDLLPQGGVYAWRRDGERHMWDPDTIAGLQRAATGNGDSAVHYETFSRYVNDENTQAGLVRGLLRARKQAAPVPIEEVEPIARIVKRFATGAMSLGALSPEAHETLAIAMNRLGGRSNSGEGGEDPRRFQADANGDLRRSAIKQVASGRFGVTAHYLANADQLQIKIAQGAKPGEGGQLPGHKVDDYIAELRHSTPGVELISPPPHHDIYSIEDLKQLIYDLRCGNPLATVSVKLASEVGVGTVAAGVVKAGADHVVIAGHDGGTGASPLSSLQQAGVPWELGLAETQQTLLANDLRSRVVLQIDGQMRTGRDVLIAALLGADEYGFSTAPLIVTGCIMMRVCHLNTCPVGVATQDPELRKRFTGKPEHVVNYLLMVADELRGLMAEMGARTLDGLIGRVDLIQPGEALAHWKSFGVDLSGILADVAEPRELPRHDPASVPERENLDPLGLAEEAAKAVEAGRPIEIRREVHNVHRAIGGVLSHAVVTQHGSLGLPEETIRLELRGSAGQSLGAWLAAGISIDLRGEANDYVGKGLSGGIMAVRPPDKATYVAEDNVIIGNVALYGATAGRAFFRGRAGERFAVRNSGAQTVVEGVGDHGCEYMTGGVVVVIGPTGHNFAAGMTGGVAFVHDLEGDFATRLNPDLVDLDPLEPADREALRLLLVEHVERTGSTVARAILDQGEAVFEQFVKVMPREYKRVIAERRAQAGTIEAVA